MAIHAIASLIPIKIGEEQALAELLDPLGRYYRHPSTEPRPDVYIDFDSGNRTHFARLVILPDGNRGEDAKRLLFASNFDGEVDDYLAHVIQITTDLDAIFSKCEGYKGSTHFAKFIKEHDQTPAVFLMAFPGESVESIKGLIELRQQAEKLLDQPNYRKALREIQKLEPRQNPVSRVFSGILSFFKRVFDALALGVRLPIGGVQLFRAYGLRTVAQAVGAVLNTTPVKFDYTQTDPDDCDGCQPLAPGDEVVRYDRAETVEIEDVFTQNQMNIISVNDPKRFEMNMAIYGVVNLGSQLSGTSAGISTIHFARWIPIDDNKRLLFVSNYDGTWENYIGDFVDKSHAVVDGAWYATIGWPNAGCRDIEYFKLGIRCHQTQSNVFYSAYPESTVMNIQTASQLKAALRKGVRSKEAKKLLQSI